MEINKYSYWVEVYVAVDIVVDVFGEPEILWRSETVDGREAESVVAISSHFTSTFFFF